MALSTPIYVMIILVNIAIITAVVLTLVEFRLKRKAK